MSVESFINFLVKRGCEPARYPDIELGVESRLIALKGARGGKKALYYSLNDDGSFGRYYNCKTGDGDYFTSKADNYADLRERKKIQAQVKKDYEAERKKAQEAAALVASETWALSDKADPSHPYLVKKGVKAHGIGQDQGCLLIPMRHKIGGDIVGLQKITKDGDKYFGKDTAKKGSFYLIGECDSDGTIYVAEGYATAATVHEATGCAVFVAFDRGNLSPVATYVRDECPLAKIIIAGDNDQSGDGQKDAKQAALAVMGHAFIPPVEGMDWNDYYNEYGMDKTIEEFAQVETFLSLAQQDNGGESVPDDDSQSAPVVSFSNDIADALSDPAPIDIAPQSDAPSWSLSLIPKGFDKDGNMIIDPRSMHNGMLLIRNLPDLKGVFRYNEFKGEIFVCRCPPWENIDRFKVRRMENIDITRCEAYLEVSDGMRLGTSKILACIEDAADKARFHPVREYFDSLKWDGVPRLATWLKDYAGCDSQPDEYLAGFGTLWMVAGVRRIRKPGCKFDTMLVFEGAENAGKSYMLRTLATFGRDIEEEYFADGIRFERIHERGSILMLQGKLIIEFAEMAGFSNKDIKAVQAWITLQEDEVEVKNKQMTAVHPRQFILAGTYNPVQGNGWLANIPGQRRFIPITVNKKIDIQGLREVREQLWAEAAHLEAQGYNIIVDTSHPLHQLALDERKQRTVIDPWEENISGFIGDRRFWRTSEVMEKMGIPVYKQNGLEHRRVCATLASIGYEYVQVREIGWKKAWVKSGSDLTPKPQEVAEEISW